MAGKPRNWGKRSLLELFFFSFTAGNFFFAEIYLIFKRSLHIEMDFYIQNKLLKEEKTKKSNIY